MIYKTVKDTVDKYIPEHHHNIRRRMLQDLNYFCERLANANLDLGRLDEKERFKKMNWIQRILYK